MTGLSPSNLEFGGAEVEQPPPEVAFPLGEGGTPEGVTDETNYEKSSRK